ncbi:MAG: AraC family transcriptional regulator [Sphaerochaeta sp.]|nr:AraC family transcriptional regulator [Sphaerochaeta sp.]
MPPIEWIDEAFFSIDRVILTENELNIPGLKMFGCHKAKMEYHSLPEHFHPHCIEFTYLVSGVATFEIAGEQFSMYPGDLLITPADALHSTQLNALALHTMYWFQVDLSNPKKFFSCDSAKSTQLIASLKNLKPLMISMEQDHTEELFSKIYNYFCTGTQTPKDIGASLLVYFIQKILFEASFERNFTEQTPDIIRALNYISHHLHEAIDLDTLSENSHLSTSHFKQKFAEQIGTPPRVYINYQKALRSKELLASGLSVTDTAMALNFSSSNYFCVVFRRYFGISPSGYRKHLRLEETESV